jgi:hypothetical protein
MWETLSFYVGLFSHFFLVWESVSILIVSCDLLINTDIISYISVHSRSMLL